jgi:hypothetical protein
LFNRFISDLLKNATLDSFIKEVIDESKGEIDGASSKKLKE